MSVKTSDWIPLRQKRKIRKALRKMTTLMMIGTTSGIKRKSKRAAFKFKASRPRKKRPNPISINDSNLFCQRSLSRQAMLKIHFK